MAKDPAARLAHLLSAATIDDDQEVYELASASVKANKADMDAHHTRIVALLKLDRFSDAIRALDEAGFRVMEMCRLERAYALYKSGHLERALELLQDLLSTTPATTTEQHAQRAARHLAAQVAYKGENFSNAADQYLSLVADRKPDEDVDMAVNTLATHAQLEWQQLARPSDLALSSPIPDSFEAVFNQGCYALAQGQLEEAVDMMGNSAAICMASDLSDDDKTAEMIPILLQQACACIRLGRLDQATETLKSIDTKDADASTATFHQISSLVLQQQSKTANPYLAERNLATLPEIPPNDKMFGYQAWRLECAKHIIDLQAQKFAGVAKSITKKLEDVSLPSAACRTSGLCAVRAAAYAEMQTGKPTIRKLTPLVASRPDDMGLVLTILQLYLNIQNYAAALTLVEAFGSRMEAKETEDGRRFRHLPGLVAIRVALLQKQGRQSAARAELAKAATFWVENVGGVGARSLLREAGIQLIHSSDPKDLATAGAAFEKLAKDAGSDEVAEAGFVASVATANYSQAEPYMAGIESVDTLADEIDIGALLAGGVVSFPSQLEKQRKRRAAEESLPSKPSKKRRLRKLPKNYVEGKEMDPERWLPLRDRSTYKPRGKKGKKKAMESTQGGPVKPGEVLELVGGAGAVKVEKAAGGLSKKKKKGKK